MVLNLIQVNRSCEQYKQLLLYRRAKTPGRDLDIVEKLAALDEFQQEYCSGARRILERCLEVRDDLLDKIQNGSEVNRDYYRTLTDLNIMINHYIFDLEGG